MLNGMTISIISVMFFSNKLDLFCDLLKTIKDAQSHHRSKDICIGNMLWFYINSQYFKSTSVTSQLPSIDLKLEAELDYDHTDNDSYVDSLINDYEKELQQCQDDISLLFPQPKKGYENYPKLLSENDIILSELKNLEYQEALKSYLDYIEEKSKAEIIEKPPTPPLHDDEKYCEICGDGDYEDDDLIVICSTCNTGVHMKCYGILVVPETDWYCIACQERPSSRNEIRCALCPNTGGIIKPTLLYTSPQSIYPNYPWTGESEQIWAHIFCIIHLEITCIQDQDLMSDIDLSKIDKNRFQLKCQKCNTKNGACVQCHHGRCTLGFHPYCAKSNFISTRDKTGFDDMNCYCVKHKPLKLRKHLESLEKKTVEDILYLARIFEKFEARKNRLPVKRKRVAGEFSYDEKFQLIKIVEERLKKEEKEGFKLSLNMSNTQKNLRGQVKVMRPLQYTVLHPQIILLEKITLPGRKFQDCYKCYSEFLFPILKQELQHLGKSLIIFEPNLRAKNKLKKFMKPIGGAKRGRKPKPVEIGDLVSEELHCLCRKPFVEATPKKKDETDEEYEQRIAESQMIACDDCGSWFHSECVGLKKYEVPETFYCAECLPKRSKIEN